MTAMKPPASVRTRFPPSGRPAGETRARSSAAGRRAAIARWAAIQRWIRVRFGADGFAQLGLPGGEIVDRGLRDLAEGRATADALLVSLAAPRLRREGVPMPRTTLPDADRRLYRLIESEHGLLAHARYLAHLRQIASFADACHQRRWSARPDAR